MARRQFSVRRLGLAGLIFFAACPLTKALAAGGPERAPVLVELFTSQSCSSCPPAEELLRSLDDTQPLDAFEIIPLMFHVDYWDNSGWKDPYSQAAFTQRQYAYARTAGDGQVFTPQAVINGRHSVVGSDRQGILGALAPLKRLDVRYRHGQVEVGGLEPAVALWVALTRKEGTNPVRGGENRGGTGHAYASVSRLFEQKHAGPRARFALSPGDAAGLTVFQQDGFGAVVSAGRTALNRF